MTECHEEASSTVVGVEHLAKSYGHVRAVEDISFRVARGEVFGLLGPNGAGKTTTVEIIEGLRDADSGRVCVLGMDVSKVPGRIKQKIGVQLQAPTLLPLISVAETLHLFAGFSGDRLPRRAHDGAGPAGPPGPVVGHRGHERQGQDCLTDDPLHGGG